MARTLGFESPAPLPTEVGITTVIKTKSKDGTVTPAATGQKEKFLVVLASGDEFVSADRTDRTFCTLQDAKNYVMDNEDPEGIDKLYIVKVVEEYTVGPFILSKAY